MYNLSKLFCPIIAKPGNTEKYVELPPCDILKPYIRCFWGTPKPILKVRRDDFKPHSTIIIPDTCMDIIFDIDYHANEISSVFCGINDRPFRIFDINKTAVQSTFAIRFYFWSVHLFADLDMKDVCNTLSDISTYFTGFKSSLESILTDKPLISERISRIEKHLIKRLYQNRRTNNNILNAIYYILKSSGTVTISELCERVCISQRQLERLFSCYIGITPKKVVDLVRFQNVWQDIYHGRKSSYNDIVFNYGYSDQSHFINDFRRYAGRTPTEAIVYSKG